MLLYFVSELFAQARTAGKLVVSKYMCVMCALVGSTILCDIMTVYNVSCGTLQSIVSCVITRILRPVAQRQQQRRWSLKTARLPALKRWEISSHTQDVALMSVSPYSFVIMLYKGLCHDTSHTHLTLSETALFAHCKCSYLLLRSHVMLGWMLWT